ncbi:MAG: hypothetical protein K9H16_12380, partial [Bacteroidales bacterium]|nr:hypothetical protein [Bacteroidales bacterium]
MLLENQNHQNQEDSENGDQKSIIDPAKKKRVRKMIILTSSVFAFLFLVVFPVLLNFFADRIIGRALTEIVHIESNGAYTLAFSEVGLNVFKREISFDSVLFIPDTSTKYSDSLPEKYALSLMIPKIHLEGATWLRAIFFKELIIENFLIEKPGIEMFFYPLEYDSLQISATNDTLNFDPKNLPDVLDRYLDMLEVKHFHFDRGSIAIMNQNVIGGETLEAMNFSLIIENFHLDSAAYLNPDKLFFADSIGLQFENGYFRYRTPTEEISFRQLDLSSDRGTLLLKDLTISRDTSLHLPDTLSLFGVHVDEVKLTGVNFGDFIQSKDLRLDRIDITNPEIVFRPKQNKTNDDLSREAFAKIIFDEVSSYFSPVEIGLVNIISGSIHLPETPVAGIGNFSISDFNLNLQHVLIDSLSFSERSKYFFVDDLNFESFNQELIFDSLDIKIFYEKLNLNTATNTLNFTRLNLDKKPGKKLYSFSLKFPGVNIVSKNMKSDFVNETFGLKLIELTDAGIEINDHSQNQETNPIDIYNLYPRVENSVKWIEIDHFKVSSAKIAYSQKGKVTGKLRASGSLNLDILNFLLNERSAEKEQVFYNDEIRSDIRNLSIEIPGNNQYFSAGAVNFNTKTSFAEIRGLHIDTLGQVISKTEDQFLHTVINAVKVDFHHVDFKSLYFGEGVFVDTINIEKPDISIVKNKIAETGATSKTQTQEVKYLLGQTYINDGRFSYAEKGSSNPGLTIDNFDVSIGSLRPGNGFSEQMAEADQLMAVMSEIYFLMPDSIHQLKIEELGFSSVDSRADVKNLSFSKVNEKVPAAGGVIEFSLPEISIRSIPVFDLYHARELRAGMLRFIHPDLVYHQFGQQQNPVSFHDFNAEIIRDQLLKSFTLVALDSIEVVDARLSLLETNNQDTERMKVTGVSLIVNDFFVDSNSTMKHENLLFAAGIQLHIDSISNSLSPKDESLRLGDVHLSTANESLTVGDLKLAVYQNETSTEKSDLNIGKISLLGIDYFNLLANKNLGFKKLDIISPDLTFNRFVSGSEEEGKNILNINAHSLIAHHLNEIKADELAIHNARVQISNKTVGQDKSYLFKHIDFDVSHVLIDSSNRVFDNKFLYSDDLSFTIHDYAENTTDSLYVFGAGTINFSSSSAAIIVDSGFLKPNFPDTVFAAKVGYQTDCLDLLIDRIKFSDIGLLDFISDQSLWIDRVEIEGLHGSDYRSKLYPLPESHFPKLPASALQALDFTLWVDSLFIRNSDFTYREYLPPALEPGIIWFSDIDLKGKNITNSNEKTAIDSLMRFWITSKLMGSGELFLNLSFDIENQNDIFTVYGLLNTFDMTQLNPMLENVAF